MVASSFEIDGLARELIAKHGLRAARVAAERLNQMIDRKNPRDRDIWACVVHLIHEQQGPTPLWTERPIYALHRVPQIAAAPQVAPHPAHAVAPMPEFRPMAAM